MSDANLEFATDTELIDELSRRWSCLVVGLARDTLVESNEEYTCFFRGGRLRALGLIHQIEEEVRHAPSAQATPPHDDHE